MKDKYLPLDYLDSFQRELINFQQGSMSIDEYTHKFRELCIHCKVNETDRLIVNCYREKLCSDIKREMIMFNFANTDEIYSKARRVEQYDEHIEM